MLSMASIMLPVRDNEGHSTQEALDSILGVILRRFNGYTESPVMSGVWRDPETGKVYRDPVKRIDIAADWNAEHGSLLSIARLAAQMMGQECVMVILPSGVQFVLPEVPAIAA